MISLKRRIMVPTADRAWTQEALHHASVLARKECGEVAIIKMITVQHIGWLGTSLGYSALKEQDWIEMEYYESVVEDYGVPYSSHIFQYYSLAEAIVDAAAYFDADIVFATLPLHLVPLWREIQLRTLRHNLERQQRILMECKSSHSDNTRQ